MKSKRSRKDKARRKKPFVSWSAMESKRFDEALLNHTATTIRLRIINQLLIEGVATIEIPIIL